MANESNEFSTESTGLPTDQGDAPVLDRVQELTWALIEDEINDGEIRLLDSLLLSDAAARTTYVGCVQLHADLLAHFAVGPAKSPAFGAPTVLGSLDDSSLSFGVPQRPEDSPT